MPVCERAPARSFVDVSPKVLLVVGVALRFVTFLFLDPQNVDGHSFVISFIAKQGRLPHSGELGQAYHPPLYYLLSTPIYRLSGSFKAVQVLSLALSVLTLLVLYHLIYRTGLIEGRSARLYSFVIACFLPQFVLYGLFVSNDTLSIFLGCCAAWCISVLARSPSPKQFALLALIAAAGLLTKATFLAYLPVLALVVLIVLRNRGYSLARSWGAALAFLVILAAATSYKQIDNYQQYGHAFLSNIDFHPDWAIRQQQTYEGLTSFVNFDFSRLLVSPSFSRSTESAYPLMLYATFWYQHVPECSFIGSSRRPFTFLAVLIYVIALVPTAAIVIGFATLTKRIPAFLQRSGESDVTIARAVGTYAAVGLLFANFGIMLAALAKYHVWSIMQGRLLFPSFFGILVLFAAGINKIETTRMGSRILKISMSTLCILFIGYLAGEIAGTIILRFMPGVKEYLRTMVA